MRVLTQVRPVSGGRPWVFLPFAGGNGDWFQPWAAALPEGDGAWVADLPGRARRLGESAETDPERVVEEILTALDLMPRAPVIFGHSLGGMLAHAVAVSAEASGVEIGSVVVSGARPPLCPTKGSDLDDASLVTLLREYAGTPDVVFEHPELLEIVLPALRADLELAAALPAPGVVRAPLVAFAGADDESAPPSAVADWARYGARWHGLTVLPGGHFFLEGRAGAMVDVVQRSVGSVVGRSRDELAGSR
jgi:surfactin synthase thioesterase subunit